MMAAMPTVIDQTACPYEAMPKHITSIQIQEQSPPSYQNESNSPEPNVTIARITHEPQQEDVKRLIEAGLASYNNGELEEAVEYYSRALEISADDAVLLYNLAVVFGDLERYEESRAAFARLVENSGGLLDPTLLAGAHQGIGAALLGLLRTSGPRERPRDLASESELEFHQAVALDPNSSGAWVGLGLALHILEKLDDAEAAFRRALEIDPDSQVATDRLRGVLKAFMQKARGIWRDRPDLPTLNDLRSEWNRF